MAKGKQKTNKKRIYFLVGALIIIVALLLSSLPDGKSKSVDSKNTSVTNSNSIEKYYSEALDATFNMPARYEVDDQFVNSVYLKSNSGIIEIHKLNTNLTNLEDFLKGFDSKRTIEIKEKGNLRIDGYDTVVRVEKFNGGPVNEEKVYFIYVPEGRVYTVSTSVEGLYSDLDQIARSFKYTP